MTEFGKQLRKSETGIPGLSLWHLPVHGDERGWFKENWQREKMMAAGLPDLRPVQNNISFNDEVGTTRGIHAEPWDKWVSVATGRIFGAWVDLREGPTFGRVFTAEIDPSTAVFIPRGVGNAYQTLEAETAYTYLVNDHWSPDAAYTFVNLADETLGVPWPRALAGAVISDKDRSHPPLTAVSPIQPRRILVTGAQGQLGIALRRVFADVPHVEYASRDLLDVSSAALGTARRWGDYGVIINAAAYTAVDEAETRDGRRRAWNDNVGGVRSLVRVAAEHGATLVHISSDYVFDGLLDRGYTETDSVCPLGVYGQTKAAADLVASTWERHYIVRTSWVIGDGRNFVRTMASLATSGVDPSVVDDQVGRPTFTDTLAAGIRHLVDTSAPFGVYNLTNSGPPASWAEVARAVFRETGHDPERVVPVSTSEYFSSAEAPVAARPANSLLDLAKIRATGFDPADWLSEMARYVRMTPER